MNHYQQKFSFPLRLIMIISFILIFSFKGNCQHKAVEIRQFSVSNEFHLQGVAVDKDYFYTISNSIISKQLKSDGSFVSMWDGSKAGVIRHLNSGVVIGNKLYCANSNFPDTPMASSIEIYDTRTMTHIGNHSFGIYRGSATWIDRKDGFWWVAFANYNGKHSFEGRDNRWTTLVKFTDQWIEVGAWVYPKEVLEDFSPNSNSGGNWRKDGMLYLTGHDKKIMYLMKIPETGYTLGLVEKIIVTNPGQAFAIDRSEKKNEIIYAVNRENNTVVVEEIK